MQLGIAVKLTLRSSLARFVYLSVAFRIRVLARAGCIIAGGEKFIAPQVSRGLSSRSSCSIAFAVWRNDQSNSRCIRDKLVIAVEEFCLVVLGSHKRLAMIYLKRIITLGAFANLRLHRRRASSPCSARLQ